MTHHAVVPDSRRLACLILGGLVGLLGLAVPAHAAVPFTPPAPVTGTSGQFNHVSATAPDGTDVVVWIAASSPSGYQLNARVRRPGATAWLPIAAGVKRRVSIQDVVIAPIGAGDFQLAWVEYGAPEVYTARVFTSARRWSPPRQVFSDAGYGHSVPSIAVDAAGTVVVAATSPAAASSSPPVYRAVVGVQRVDGTFARKWLSPPGGFGVPTSVAVSPDGRILVPFTSGYDTADWTATAATRGPSGAWAITPLSVPGDANRVVGTIGAGGRAVVAWTAPASGASAVRVATAQVGAAPPTWGAQDVSTSGGTPSSPRVAVAADGAVTVLWNANGGDSVIMARQLTGSTFGAPLALSEAGRLATVGSVVARPDGRVAVLYGLYTTGADPLGLRHVVLSDGVPGPTTELTTADPGGHNQFVLGVDAASRGNVVYARGFPPPDTDLRWLGQSGAAPAVLTSRFSGDLVRRARVTPLSRHRLRCDSGFWVEARTTSYSWYRGTTKVRGASGKTYRWTAADAGRRFSCRVTGRSDLADRSTTLTSRPRRVG